MAVACSVKTEELVWSIEKLLNVAKSMVEEMADVRNAATMAAERSIGVLAGAPRTEVPQAEVLHSVEGYGGSTSTAKPGDHASSRELLDEGGHESGADPEHQSIELQLR